MIIEVYKSALCPRCAYTLHTLKQLQNELGDIKIKQFDLFSDITSFRKANIRMIPTIRIAETKKSWVIPNKNEIKDFILKHR